MPDEIAESLPPDLVTRALLELAELTQSELARKIGKTRAFVSAMATGKSKPSLATALAIERATGCLGAYSGGISIVEVSVLRKKSVCQAAHSTVLWLVENGFLGRAVYPAIPMAKLYDDVVDEMSSQA